MSLLQDKEEDGKKVSPVLPEHIKNFLIDIDGTVGEDIPNEEPWRMEDAAVYPDALQKCNQWYDQGHIIFFFTSRTEAHREVTERWLNQSGFKY
ncbi:MAG: phosphoheptose isomerase, partial [Bacteroidota bacterium]